MQRSTKTSLTRTRSEHPTQSKKTFDDAGQCFIRGGGGGGGRQSRECEGGRVGNVRGGRMCVTM